MLSHSVVSNSLQPHGLYPTRLLCPSDFPGKNTGVGCHFFLQGIFPTQESNPCLLCLLHWHVGSLPLSHLVSPFCNLIHFTWCRVEKKGIELALMALSLPTAYRFWVCLEEEQVGISFVDRALRWGGSLQGVPSLLKFFLMHGSLWRKWELRRPCVLCCFSAYKFFYDEHFICPVWH